MKSLKTCSIADAQSLDASHLSMIRNCIAASRGMLDTFLSIPFATVLALPAYLYAGRVIYAVILLIKIHRAISLSETGLGQFMRLEELCLEKYLHRLVDLSNHVINEDERNSLSRALLVIGNLNDWLHTNHLQSDHPTKGAGNKRPLAYNIGMQSGPPPQASPNTFTATSGLNTPSAWHISSDLTDPHSERVDVSNASPLPLYTQNIEAPVDLPEVATLFDESIWDEFLNQSMFI